jgi:hypothetical protein
MGGEDGLSSIELKKDNYFIILDSNPNSIPFKIGTNNNPKFKVTWDGKLYARDGEFSGYIDAEEGYLGDLTLYGDLDASSGTITGGTITGGTITGAKISGSEIFFGNSVSYIYNRYIAILGGDGQYSRGDYIDQRAYANEITLSYPPVINGVWLEFKEKIDGSESGYLGTGRGNDTIAATSTLTLSSKTSSFPIVI